MKNDILFTINYFVLLQGKNVKDDVSKWNQRRVLLHVLLLSKELISGSSRESDDEDRNGLVVADVISNATVLASSAASKVYAYNPPRWQVKSEGTFVLI